MEIYNVLNNNVVIVLDENNNEKVVCGKGIAYSKKKGDKIDISKINKTFVLKDANVNEHFKQLIKEIPLEYVNFTDEIIHFIYVTLHKKINENLLVSLSDHIYTMIQRVKRGVNIRSTLTLDIKRFYREEFDIALQILDMLEDKFKVNLPEDEAVFITLHIVNASIEDTDTKQIIEIMQTMKILSNIVKSFFDIEFNKDSVYYYRFMTHIKFFSHRLMNNNNNTLIEKDNSELFDKICTDYSKSALCVEKIATFLNDKYHYNITKEEKLYLIIHIERVVSKGVI